MRILVLTKRQYMGKDVLDDRFGRFRELPLELAKLGHQVVGVCLSYRPKNEGQLKDSSSGSSASVSWSALNLGPLVIPGLIRYRSRVKSLLNDFRPDLIWACSDAFHAVVGVWLSRFCETKCVVDLYDNFEAFAATRLTGILPFFKRAVLNADGVTCFSQRLANYILKGCERKKPTVVIENGAQLDIFYPRDEKECRHILGLPLDTKIIGTAGALYHNRNIDILFRAFELLSAQDDRVHLAIAGPRERGIKIPNGPLVHDFGILPFDKVPLLINALDVAVSCYKDSEIGRYSFPQKAYEILACQTPLVSAAVGTMIDLLSSHPECLFESDSPESLARVVRSQLKKPTKIQVRVPSWADVARQLETFFFRILKTQA